MIPPLEDLQCKRLAARRHKTTYVYDYPSVFANALKGMWIRRIETGEPAQLPKGEREHQKGIFVERESITWSLFARMFVLETLHVHFHCQLV